MDATSATTGTINVTKVTAANDVDAYVSVVGTFGARIYEARIRKSQQIDWSGAEAKVVEVAKLGMLPGPDLNGSSQELDFYASFVAQVATTLRTMEGRLDDLG